MVAHPLGVAANLLQGNGGGNGAFEALSIVTLLLVLVALAVFVLNIVATVSVVRGRLQTLAKVLWLAGIWFLSPVGMIVYFLLGRTK